MEQLEQQNARVVNLSRRRDHNIKLIAMLIKNILELPATVFKT